MSDERGRFVRLLGDPVRVRRPAEIAGLGLAVVSGAGYLLLDAGLAALLYGLTWLALLPVAGLLGYATAFFIEHGVGVRRALLEAILGALVALGSCMALTAVDRDAGGLAGQLLAGTVAGLLYLGIFRGLAAGVGLGLGRGLGYAGRKIQGLDDEGW